MVKWELLTLVYDRSAAVEGTEEDDMLQGFRVCFGEYKGERQQGYVFIRG